jgi:hypothetical protein
MKGIVTLLLVVLGLQAIEPAFAARRVVVRRGPRRTVVVVHRGWPIRRPARMVVVRPARVVVRVAPVRYLPLAVWTGVGVAASAAPAHDVLVWEDGETLAKGDDWTEFTLEADSRGTGLWLEVVNGRVQFDWAEVVFENGDARAVDMKAWTRGPGLYHLLDFRDGRKVDHVRLMARAQSYEARVALRMEK